jgi:hypothetical protein
VQTDVVPVNEVLNNFPANTTACRGNLSCVTSLDRRVAATLNTFAGQLRGIPMPSGQASSANAALVASVSNTASIFARLGAATTVDQYQSIVQSSGLQQSVDQMSRDYNNLGNALNL